MYPLKMYCTDASTTACLLRKYILNSIIIEDKKPLTGPNQNINILFHYFLFLRNWNKNKSRDSDADSESESVAPYWLLAAGVAYCRLKTDAADGGDGFPEWVLSQFLLVFFWRIKNNIFSQQFFFDVFQMKFLQK